MSPTTKRITLLLAATFPCLGIPAENGATTLDAVVVSGSRVEHNTFDLPAAVDVVDAARIGADQARVNASEALAAVPGITVQNRQNYAQDLQISSRGFGARSAFGVRGIRLISDGIPASMPDGQGQAATFNLDRAERIEVLRGPMAVVYGNHAGGVIQMFTPDGKGAPNIEGGFVAGSNNTWKTDISAQGEVGGLGYVIDASRFATDGYRDHSKAERDQSMVKLTYRPSADGKLTFIANSFKQTADDPQGQTWAGYQANPRSVAQPVLDYNTRKSIDHMQGGLTYEHRFGDHSVLVSAYAGQRSTIQYQSIPPGPQGNSKHSGGVIDFDRDFAGASTRWIGRFQLAGGKLTTTVGVDYEQSIDNRRGYENFIGTTLGVKGVQRRAEEDRVASFDQYAQAEWQGERWTFSGGVRHSNVSFSVKDAYLSNGNDGGSVSYEKTTPTIAAMFRLTPTVNIYASAARGFEAPTFNELFYSGPGGTFSYNLKPSTSTHYETGLKAFIGSDSRLDLAVFQIETEDELVVDSAAGGRTTYRNAGQTMRRGLEAAVDSRWANNLSTRVAYTFLDARYDEAFTTSSGLINADNRLPGVPAQSLFGELAWKHPASGFHAAVEGIARSKVYVEDTNTRQAAPGYVIANLRFGVDRKVGDVNLRTFLRFDNIFDRQYVGSVIVGDGNSRYYEAAPGCTWLAGVSARYSF
ncbi:TonB-dependent receptor family protein [Ferribacterium limneticum]|uniref:TonB-dependent receptor family protein n=1 Tax=Ferribacterium limneticum TaxID=76259 RepID=UPI001CF977AD|nr:TonB-dependent receptor [Ferribacterium limneticum]UCV27058.1 TonB-dependent receptor [Ferribacterium limneticum]UCV30975.1 TonB-dependent receptor [Ferribacterium limneticum]